LLQLEAVETIGERSRDISNEIAYRL